MAERKPNHASDAAIGRLETRVSELAESNQRASQHLEELSTSLGKVMAAQRKREKELNLNSFVAYVLFTILIGGVFYAVYQVRVNQFEASVQDPNRKTSIATEPPPKQAKRSEQTSKQMEELMALADAGDADGFTAAARAINTDALTEVEKRWIAQTTQHVATASLEGLRSSGEKAEAKKDWAGAIAIYTQALDALSKLPVSTSAAQACAQPYKAEFHFRLGNAYLAVQNVKDAEQALNAWVSDGAESCGFAEARFLRGEVFTAASNNTEAAVEYQRFLKEAPNHRWANAAKRRLGLLPPLPATRSLLPTAAPASGIVPTESP